MHIAVCREFVLSSGLGFLLCGLFWFFFTLVVVNFGNTQEAVETVLAGSKRY